jgi:hypothetical protein
LLAIVSVVSSEEAPSLSLSEDDTTLLEVDQEAKAGNPLLVTGKAFHLTK